MVLKPHYLIATESGKTKAILPIMEVNSIFTGKKAISLPFSDFCEPLISKDISYKRIRNKALEFCKIRKFSSLELRDSKVHLEDSIISPAGYQHLIDLSDSEEQLLTNFQIIQEEILEKQAKIRLLLKLIILFLHWKTFIV